MDYLIHGKDYLARFPTFDLVGRDKELEDLCSILLRKKANNVLLVGPSGVGCSSIILGLQKYKDDPKAPFEIASKRLFWLDNDLMTFNGDDDEIHENFQKIIKTLQRTPDSILIITKAKTFIESSKAHGGVHFLNTLNSLITNNQTQVILEVSDSDADYVWKSNSDMMEYYTMLDIQEPKPEFMFDIVKEGIEGVVERYGISIEDKAIMKAIELTTKYSANDQSLSKAQPDRSITLIDRAYSIYILGAYRQHPQVPILLASKTTENAEEIDLKIARMNEEFVQTQLRMTKLLAEQKDAEFNLLALEESLEVQIKKENETKKTNEVDREQDVKRLATFNELTNRGGFESDEVRDIRGRIAKVRSVIDVVKTEYDKIAKEINSQLKVTEEDITSTFSRISKIPANRLDENDKEMLRNLQGTLEKRIFGQAEAVRKLSDAVKTARIGKRNKAKPQAAFMFLGPSGVGKTEIAKALAEALHGDESKLTRFDMSEYMEKHAVARMIGAPPGYEGFEAGGILTNLMRANGQRILLFDEIEKAHPDIFNIFLQILSDGRLTDNVGRTVSFADSIIVMTTNIGQTGFLDDSLNDEEKQEYANKELQGTYRSEFLNRFAGRENIVCFKKLELDSVQKIVTREIKNLSDTYAEEGLEVKMSEEELYKFCKDRYDPVIGGRGLPGYIQTNLEPQIVTKILNDEKGAVEVNYNEAERRFVLV